MPTGLPTTKWLVAAANVPRSSAQSARNAAASQHAGHATLDLGAFQRQLPEPDVVERLDSLAPGVDLRLVHITGGGGVLEEQRQRKPLIHMLSGRRVGVDDLLVTDLVGVLEVLQVVVGQV